MSSLPSPDRRPTADEALPRGAPAADGVARGVAADGAALQGSVAASTTGAVPAAASTTGAVPAAASTTGAVPVETNARVRPVSGIAGPAPASTAAAAAASSPRARADARLVLGVALVLLAMGVAFADTLRAMVAVWRTENFQHGFLIVPMAAWLAYTRRDALLRAPRAPFWPAALAVAGGCALWLAGRLAGVNAAEQLALVAMLPAALALVHGWRFVWTVAYPLAFLVFAVPFGEGFYPMMMEQTARFTVAAVRLSGVPVVREHLFFELPTGRWSVVEACSGLRYLLAALPLATAYAYLTWRSWKLRALFIAMTAVIAIVANWVRAYLIVMLGHLSGMRIAVGVDHLLYGWIFFGIVMAAVFWIGAHWHDPAPADGDARAPAPAPARNAGAWPQFAAVALAATLFGGTVAAAANLVEQGERTVKLEAFAPLVRTGTPPAAAGPYAPVYAGDVARVAGWSSDAPPVGLLVAQYVRQHRSGEMINYENGVNPGRADAGQQWRVNAKAAIDPSALGAPFPAGPVNEYRIAGPGGRYLVWEWFQVNGRTIADAREVKLRTAVDLLLGRGDESLAWVLWTPYADDPADARRRLVEFAGRLGARAPEAGLR